jgi:hypothetical protein
VRCFDIVTNDFGSFKEFILPATGLTGNYIMQAEEPKDYEKTIMIWDNPF